MDDVHDLSRLHRVEDLLGEIHLDVEPPHVRDGMRQTRVGERPPDRSVDREGAGHPLDLAEPEHRVGRSLVVAPVDPRQVIAQRHEPLLQQQHRDAVRALVQPRQRRLLRI